MQCYRLYPINGRRIAGPGQDFTAMDDAEAIRVARALMKDYPVELWHGVRCVARLAPAPVPLESERVVAGKR